MDWMGVSIKQMKLHTVWLSGYARGVACSTEGMIDAPGFLLTSHYRRWSLRLLRSSRGTKTCPYSASEIFAETLLLGTKRGAPSVEDDQVELAASDYLQQMGTRVDISGPYRERVIDAITTTSMEVFGWRDEVPVGPYVPSIKAGYEAPRYAGGILGSIFRKGVERGESLVGSERELIAARCVTFLNTDGQVTHEIRWYYGRIVDWKSIYEHALRVANEDVLSMADCQIYMIREPLKLRTITAGTPELYGAASPILKVMRKGLKRFEVFGLTRHQNNSAWLSDRMNRFPLVADRYMSLWDRFVSGDYQQSTNDLSMEATDTVRYSVFGGRLAEFVCKTLGSQTLHWTEASEIQRRGQLMGSPLSFPVLCVINVALARLAYEMVHPELKGLHLDAFPMAVNGDDFVARMSTDIYALWEQLIAAVGWKLSPGKSYFLGSLAQVNSQTMKVSRVSGPDSWRPTYVLGEPIPFVNDGFIHQMGKATQQIDLAPVEAMSQDWRERWFAFERLPEGIRERSRQVMLCNLDNMAKRLYRDGLTPYEIHPTNPVWLGGFGIPGRFNPKTAAHALACEPPVKDDLFETFDRTEPYQVEPWSEQVRSVLSRDELCDALLEDLEQWAFRENFEEKLPMGHIDIRTVG
jgi:hypothetical protein